MDRELNSANVIGFVEARNRLHLGRKRLEIDVDRYQSYLDEGQISEEARVEFIYALWTVIVDFR